MRKEKIWKDIPQPHQIAQKRRDTEKVFRWVIPCILGILAAVAVVFGINYHGFTYDEPIYAGFGSKSAQWILQVPFSLFDGTFARHFSADSINRAWFAAIDMQPPLVQVLSGLSSEVLSDFTGGLLAPRLPTAIFFGIAVGVLFWLVEKIYTRRAAFFAVCALILLPRFFHDAHLTTLDLPVSALILLTAAVFYEAARLDSWHLAIISGILFGLGILTKLNAIFIVGVLFLWSIIFYRRMLLKAVVAFFVVAPLIFFIGWPWLWHDTFTHLSEYLAFHVQHYPVLTYYLGKSYAYAPWHYPFVMTAVTVPAVTLVLMLTGLGDALFRRRMNAGKWLLILGALGYLLPSAMPFAPKYNGVRLFLPAFPFLAGLAGGGFELMYTWLSQKLARKQAFKQMRNFHTKFALLLGGILLLPALIGLIKIRPHELAYYNGLIGGPAGARKAGLETIYWGSIYLQALPALNQLPAGTRVLITPQGVISLLVAYQRGGALKSGIEWVAPPPPGRQTPNWPQQKLKDVDLVVFQCAQAEFDALSWKLYKEGRPEQASIYQDNVPLLLIYTSHEARRVFGKERNHRLRR